MRHLILIGEGQHYHIEERSVKEQDKDRQYDKFPELALPDRIIKPSGIQHLKHKFSPPLPSYNVQNCHNTVQIRHKIW